MSATSASTPAPATPGERACSLERLVDLAHVRDLARLHRQVVTHEAVEVGAVGLLPEVHLHRPPVLLVEPGLELRLQAHQDEVADQVGLAQLAPGGVQALEDELRVVLVAAERDVHDHELRQALAERRRGRPCASATRSLKNSKFCLDADRVAPWAARCCIDQGDERGLVGLREQQLVAPLAVFERVEQVVVAQLLRRRSHPAARCRPGAAPAPRSAASRWSAAAGRRSPAGATGSTPEYSPFST